MLAFTARAAQCRAGVESVRGRAGGGASDGITSHTLLDDGVLECEFTLAGFTDILWMPPTATPSSSVPLSLLNQPGGFDTRRMYPRLLARARAAAAEGFASVTIELPRTGRRRWMPCSRCLI